MVGHELLFFKRETGNFKRNVLNYGCNIFKLRYSECERLLETSKQSVLCCYRIMKVMTGSVSVDWYCPVLYTASSPYFVKYLKFRLAINTAKLKYELSVSVEVL
jgi:hypothetical protein